MNYTRMPGKETYPVNPFFSLIIHYLWSQNYFIILLTFIFTSPQLKSCIYLQINSPSNRSTYPLINSVKMTVSTCLQKECKIYDYHAEKTSFDTEVF